MAWLSCIPASSRLCSKISSNSTAKTALVRPLSHSRPSLSVFVANVTNGVTFRRWLLQANPSLSALITKTLGSDDYLTNSMLLKGLEKYADDVKFQRAFYDCKLANKERLAHYIEETQGRKINRDALFDIQVKRIHAYKRQVSLARSDRS
jgi:glucan phosphorylase